MFVFKDYVNFVPIHIWVFLNVTSASVLLAHLFVEILSKIDLSFICLRINKHFIYTYFHSYYISIILYYKYFSFILIQSTRIECFEFILLQSYIRFRSKQWVPITMCNISCLLLAPEWAGIIKTQRMDNGAYGSVTLICIIVLLFKQRPRSNTPYTPHSYTTRAPWRLGF